MTEAWFKGYDEYWTAEGISDNPYEYPSQEWTDFENGYRAAQLECELIEE